MLNEAVKRIEDDLKNHVPHPAVAIDLRVVPARLRDLEAFRSEAVPLLRAAKEDVRGSAKRLLLERRVSESSEAQMLETKIAEALAMPGAEEAMGVTP